VLARRRRRTRAPDAREERGGHGTVTLAGPGEVRAALPAAEDGGVWPAVDHRRAEVGVVEVALAPTDDDDAVADVEHDELVERVGEDLDLRDRVVDPVVWQRGGRVGGTRRGALAHGRLPLGLVDATQRV